jgi:RNA polymerase sigma-70 factor (sigma-E family)
VRRSSAAGRGDEEYAALYAATWPRLYRVAYAVTRDAGRAEDAVQTAMAKAYASWDRVRAADRPEDYLRTMVMNEVLGARRRGWWRLERSGTVPDGSPGEGPDDPGHRTVLDRDELWGWLARLGPRQRAVVVLRYFEDLSEAEIADTLGCSRGTVKSQASAALATLRRHAERATDDREEAR